MSATVEQLEALPEGAVVRSGIGEHAVKRHTGKWARWHNPATVLTSADLAVRYDQIEVLYPQPELDHSMCARLVKNESLSGVWGLMHPNGEINDVSYDEMRARALGYEVPDTRTVKERVADVLKALDIDDAPYAVVAERLAKLGLLAKDGDS